MTEPHRDAEFERDFLEQVAKVAGQWSETVDFKHFADEVHDRLRKGAAEYGPGSFVNAKRSEVSEEGADVCAWSVLFAQADRLNPELSDDVAMENLADYAYCSALGFLIRQRILAIEKRSR